VGCWFDEEAMEAAGYQTHQVIVLLAGKSDDFARGPHMAPARACLRKSMKRTSTGGTLFPSCPCCLQRFPEVPATEAIPEPRSVAELAALQDVQSTAQHAQAKEPS
jgi:hypothetical protein